MSNPAALKSPVAVALYEKVFHRNTTQRALNLTIFILLLSLLSYRLLSFKNHGFAWFLAFLCESSFTLTWLLITNMQWTPLTYKTYPQRLQQRVTELPSVDMFVTTADAELEPPIITVNTVLSLLAVDYPAHKLACYVSDDGCSPLTFYSLVEASKFAKLWVPFCKKYKVQVRAPFRYFLLDESSEPSSSSSWEFQQDWKIVKEKYEQLSQNIKHAAKKSSTSSELTGELAVFSNTERKNHPAIVKVIWENKEGLSNGISHLIYISREKRPKHPHYYKAGAMNALIRVSGLMTNAPFMLNVDCDMYANNPEIVLQAMCLLLGSNNKTDFAFIQSPQNYYDNPANPLAIWNESTGKGVVGIQGPFYAGTGTFHRRKVIYGLGPDELEHQGGETDDLLREFGKSKEFIISVQGKSAGFSSNMSISLDAAHEVASCGYEYGSSWGKTVGLLYGSATEDLLTGLKIHAKGWRSGYCSPDPHAFLGCGPPNFAAALRQQKRWTVGLLEILLSRNNPILASITGKLQFRQCLMYLWMLSWGLRSIPELCYVALPAYCIITNSSFLPKVQEPVICIPIAIFMIYKLHSLSEYIQAGFPIKTWWVNCCMSRICATSPWLFAFINTVLNLFGISETGFEVTQKVDQSEDNHKLMFDESPFFLPGTAIMLVHLGAWATRLLGMQLQPQGGESQGQGSGLGEYFCSVYVVLNFFPFLQGLFMKGHTGIPLSTVCKSAGLALLFLQSCKMMSSMN